MGPTRRRSPSTSDSLAFAALAAILAVASDATAQEQAEQPDPALPTPDKQIDFGLRAVTSANYATQFAGRGGIGNFDFSDTYAYARARTPLYDPTSRAGALFALTFPDEYDEPGTLLVAEANGFYESRWLTARLGRGRLRTNVIPFPTLRDDDLIRWSDAQNPFSDGRSTADHQFGNTGDVAFWPTPRLFANAHVENLANFVVRPATLASFEVNSYGVTLGYREIPALARTAVVRQAGLAADVYHVDLGGRELIADALAGAWLNLIRDPVHGVDWRVQGIYDRGVPSLAIGSVRDTFLAEQASIVSSIGYSYRREMLPTFRTNVIGAYKRYLHDAIDQYSVVFNAFYSLGVTADIGVQYQLRSQPKVPEAFGDNFSHAVKVAFVIAMDTTPNRIFDERDSLLNTESGYLP